MMDAAIAVDELPSVSPRARAHPKVGLLGFASQIGDSEGAEFLLSRPALEIPPQMKKRLALDSERSWIILTDQSFYLAEP
jgi:hypothetical protein